MAIFLLVALFLGDLKTTVVVIVAVLMIDLGKPPPFFNASDLLGMMYFWNIKVSTVSLINLLLCLGLAVDACCHVAHAFNNNLKTAKTSSEAITTAVHTV